MKTPQTISALDAALKVLQDEGKPLHYQEITRRVLSAGLWKTAGKTPAATINAQLATNIKRNGLASAFRRAGRGIFALNADRADPTPRDEQAVRTEDRALYVSGPKTGETLSFTESAARILDAAGGKPMHYRDITRHALEHHMLDTEGKTPEATMYSPPSASKKSRSQAVPRMAASTCAAPSSWAT